MITPLFASCTKGEQTEATAPTTEAATSEGATETDTLEESTTAESATTSSQESSDTESSASSETSTETVNTETGDTETEDTETKEEATDPQEASNDAYYIIEAVAEYGRNGLANGWKYDNRFDLTNTTGVESTIIHDQSNDKFYRFIRDFESENEGSFKLELIVTASSSNEGIYIGMYDKDENCLFGLTPKDGVWCFFGENEISTGIAISESNAGKFSIEIEFDLDKNTASLIMNNTYCGEITIKEGAIERLTLGSNKRGTGTLGFKYVRLMKNYPVVDRFIQGDNSANGQIPANWSVEGDFRLDYIESMRLYDMHSVRAVSAAGSVSTATRSFKAVSGHVSFETMILLPKKTDGASLSLMSGGREIITFTTKDGGKIYVGEQMVHDYIANVWQTLHVEAYTDQGIADIYVNGKKRATVSIDATSFDGIKVGFAPNEDAEMWFDDVEIYEIIEHEDYPSYPEVAPSDDYNIGMNVCWLWRDQQSGEGWDATSPFREFDSYLGFYDEGLRETADWELKWMAEHGIDFIHACWYAPSSNTNAPIKEMRHSYAALHDGYMMAKYSDLVDFCIMWENNNQDVTSFEQFKEYIWNYWVEYYFTDERYARLDNKAVLTIWSTTKLKDAFGSNAEVTKALKWMNKEIQKYGYDGMIILSSTQGVVSTDSYDSLKDLGFAGTYAYHWGANGYDPILQNNNNATNLQNSAASKVHHIPTVSMGFNDVARNESRSPIISVEDHLTVCQDIKTLLGTLDTGTWKDNTLFISTWNEYSEGTYLFPTESTGFDYLENIRLTFTADTSDHSEIDVRPTESQIDRITHLYPQNHSPIRWYEFEEAEPESDVKIYVNGQLLNLTFAPKALENGDYEIVGEARKRGFYSLMRLYYEWDRFNGVLTLYTYRDRTVQFTVGSDIMMFGDKERKLDYTFTLRDGLPVFHIKDLCKWLGYTVTETEAGLFIQAASEEEYNELMSSVTDQWEFSIPGEVQGWKGQNSKIEVTEDGTLLITPTGDDVAVIHSVSFNASNYTVIKIGVKYDPNIVKQSAHLFFTTGTQSSFAGTHVISTTYQIEGKGIGDTVEAIFILRNNLNFNGKITQIRIDPYTGSSFIGEIDYIRCEYVEEYSFESDLMDPNDENQWDFDTDSEGWEFSNTTSLGVTDGCLSGSSINADPYVSKNVSFAANRYHILCIGVKYFEGIETAGAKMYFQTSSSSTWDEAKAIKGIVFVPQNVREGDTVNIYFELNKNTSWTGNITILRFDPINAEGQEYSIDYIKLYKKYSLSGTPLVSITDPENIPEGYTVSTTTTGEILIVDDPKVSGNKVFKVNCTTNEANKYTYFNLGMTFEAGKTYIISYKIMPLTDKNGKDFKDTIVGGNLRYGTEAGVIKDHTFDGGQNKSSSSEWIEVFQTVTVSPGYVPNQNDCFQIWGKHTSEGVGISYLVKDIEIAVK